MEQWIYRADREMEGRVMRQPSLMRAKSHQHQLSTEKLVLGDTSKYKVFGDKKHCTFIIGDIVKPLKVIYLCRDGRDVVSSEVRRKSSRWRLANRSVKALSEDWAFDVNYWLEHRYKYDQLTLKFEDLINSPEETLHSVSQFLDISSEPLVVEFEKVTNQRGKRKGYHKTVAQSGESHIGYHNVWIPNWKKEFHPSAINILKKMDYI
jgi:hypothetical protein